MSASDDELRVGLPEGPVETFRLISVPSLTRRTVADVLDRAHQASGRQVFVSYGRASTEARDALRAASVSFAGQDGRVFVRAPGIFVERDEPTRPRPAERWGSESDERDGIRNPFAKRSSRVPRWLVLHHQQPFSPSELAKATDLNPAAVSRVVRALEDAALVHAVKSHVSSGRRSVRVERPRDLLEAWLPLWQRRRVRHLHWDIGARNVDETLNLLRDALDRADGWAIGGLAGAATVRRVVEPANALLWTTAKEVARFADLLQPEPARRGLGAVQVAIAPDPWTLGLARRVHGLPIVDPVQLWLDCASEGERALEAADAVADTARWS